VEHLERAYMNDAIEAAAYSAECSKLIGKFKSMENSLVAGSVIVSAEAFMVEYHMLDCRKAREVLLIAGVPSTTFNRQPVGDADAGAAILRTTEAIITCLDGLSLGNVAVDEVQPAVKDVMDAITKVPHLPADFPSLPATQRWLEALNAMRAAETVDEASVRQLIFDVNALYAAFKSWVEKRGGSGR
jgi:ESCRT-I complex subunit VPS28